MGRLPPPEPTEPMTDEKLAELRKKNEEFIRKVDAASQQAGKSKLRFGPG